nr:craniofacial development protein 2-like [Syngnathus scovelli]
MTPGLSDNLQEISDVRKTAVINNELLKLRIDISTLQETRLHGSGSLKEKDYTFFWRGKPPEETREYGVGFAVRNTLLGAVVTPTGGSERILALMGPVHLVSVYAPTLSSPQEIKDRFYDELEATLKIIPSREQLYLLGDFNARVGADRDSWPSCLGHHCIGRLNENGQRLLEFCTYHHLCITNKYFQTKPIHKVSWRHPRSGHWHQLDLIITRTSDLRGIHQTRSLHSAVCDTDHSLVLCRVKLQAKNLHRSKPKAAPRIDSSKTTDSTKAIAFLCALEVSLHDPPLSSSAHQYWDGLRNAIQSTALSVFGKKQGKPND